MDGSAVSEAVSAASSMLGTVTDTLSVGNIVSMLGIAVGAGVGFFLTWFGIRKVVRTVKSSFSKGKLPV